jgi:hypothetical protein
MRSTRVTMSMLIDPKTTIILPASPF